MAGQRRQREMQAAVPVDNDAVVNLDGQFDAVAVADIAEAARVAAQDAHDAAVQAAYDAADQAAHDAAAQAAHDVAAQAAHDAVAQAARDAVAQAARVPRTPVDVNRYGHQQGGLTPSQHEELLGKLAISAWLMAQEPQRMSARPQFFFEGIVDGLWDMGVRESQDIATLSPSDCGFLNPMQRGFFQGIAHPAAVSAYGQAAAVSAVAAPSTSEELFKQQLLMFKQIGDQSGKKKKDTAPVDMEVELKGLGLSGISHSYKPSPEELDKFKAKAEELAQSRSCPFVNVNLHKFLPIHARDMHECDESDDEDKSETLRTMQRVMGVKKTKRSMSILQCLESLHRYVLAGAMTKQFKHSSGLTHIANVMEVANKAAKAGKRHQLAVDYDSRVREKWAYEAHAAGKSGVFDIDEAMSKIDKNMYENVLEDARGSDMRGAPLQSNFAQCPFEGEGKGRGKSKAFDGICNFCGVKGHKRSDCYKWKAEQQNGGEARLEGDSAPEAKRRRM